MKQITLTKGQVAIVDDVDYERICSHKWYANPCSHTEGFYAARNPTKSDDTSRTIYMHREIVGAGATEHVDHSNHNTLDNRRCNLRLCSPRQNSANQALKKSNASGFKGVHWRTVKKKWRAMIRLDSGRKFIGHYSTALEAALAYDKELLLNYGEFALTNKRLGLIH